MTSGYSCEKGALVRSENERVHYRTRFELRPCKANSLAIVPAYKSVFYWVLSKEQRRLRTSTIRRLLKDSENQRKFLQGGFSYPEEYSGGATSLDYTALCTRALYSGEKKIPDAWVLEYDEPDGATAFRHWHTCIGFKSMQGGACEVNVKVSYYTLSNYVGRPLPEPRPNIPRFVRELFSLDGCRSFIGETAVGTKLAYLEQRTFEQSFASPLCDKQRGLPFVVITSDHCGHFPVSDMEDLARNLVGIANVYAVNLSNDRMRTCLFDLFGYEGASFQYKCPSESLTIYRSGIELANEKYLSNRMVINKSKLASYGPSLLDVLNRSLGRSYLKGTAEFLDTSDIEWHKSRAELSQLKSRLEQLRNEGQRHAEEATKREAELASSVSQESIDELLQLLKTERESVAEWQGLAELYSASNDELQLRISALESNDDRAELEDKVSSLQFRCEQAESRADQLAGENAALKKEEAAIDSLTAFPKSLEEQLRLASQLWATRIVVLPEAFDSAKRYTNGDADEQWRVLASAATALWRLKFQEGCTTDICSTFTNQTGIEMTLTETKATKANQDCVRLRQRSYKGRAIDITPHLKGKGKSKMDPFRLHFYFDEEGQKIVIGHCGCHLLTAGTGKVK